MPRLEINAHTWPKESKLQLLIHNFHIKKKKVFVNVKKGLTKDTSSVSMAPSKRMEMFSDQPPAGLQLFVHTQGELVDSQERASYSEDLKNDSIASLHIQSFTHCDCRIIKIYVLKKEKEPFNDISSS